MWGGGGGGGGWGVGGGAGGRWNCPRDSNKYYLELLLALYKEYLVVVGIRITGLALYCVCYMHDINLSALQITTFFFQTMKILMRWLIMRRLIKMYTVCHSVLIFD